jgi:hypothetical protein
MGPSGGVGPAAFTSRLKAWLDLIQGGATIAALILAGWWFVRQGEARPRLNVQHHLAHRRVSHLKQILVLDATLSNIGNVPIELRRGKVRLYEITPEDKRITEDDELDDELIDPGETEQLYKEYPLDGDVTSVRVDTFFENSATPGAGWELTTFYDLGSKDAETSVTRGGTPPGRKRKTR